VTSANDSYIEQEPAWQLLTEFSASVELDSKDQFAEQVAGAVRELGLQSIQIERIHQAVLGALRKAAKRESQDLRGSPPLIRIWISYAHTGARSRSNVVVERRGWGFFMIEKQELDPRASGAAAQSVIELCLYQERDRSQRDV
jgi:hypothetical protein